MQQPPASSPWPQIGDILPNHDGGKPQAVNDLEGRTFDLTGTDGQPAQLAFANGRSTWHIGALTLHAHAEVFLIREGIYFINLDDGDLNPGVPSAGSSALVLDLAQNRFLGIRLTVPDPRDGRSLLQRVSESGSQSAVEAAYFEYGVGGKPAAWQRSTALVGKHMRYVYSDTHVYDHIYLSERYYTWFCHQGPDAGLGDFEECDYFEIRPDLILVCWREKLLPCGAIMIEDHAAMRSAGKIFGVDSETGKASQSAVGAAMQLLFHDAG